MKTSLFLSIALLAGCTTISQTADSAGSGTNAVRRTTITIRTTGDAKTVVDTLRASNTDKIQSLGAKGVEESGSTTNLNSIIDSVVAAAIKAAVKP